MKKLALLSLAMAVSGTAVAADTSADFNNLLQKVSTYQAQFVQSIKDANGQPVSKTKGQVTISRPGKFHWKSVSPDPVLIVADGKFLWTYDQDLSQVTKQDLKEILRNSPAGLLAGTGEGQLSDQFAITNAKKNKCNKTADQCFSLKPKQKDSTFANIYMGFNQGKLVDIRMHDPLGQDVHTEFTQVKLNGKVGKNMFNFKPPAGVDVIQAGQ